MSKRPPSDSSPSQCPPRRLRARAAAAAAPSCRPARAAAWPGRRVRVAFSSTEAVVRDAGRGEAELLGERVLFDEAEAEFEDKDSTQEYVGGVSRARWSPSELSAPLTS